MTQLDKELVRLSFQAVREPGKWQQVLHHIISVTPAKAAIITLREKATCQIVNDDALEREYHSPLIQGFPLEAVVHYINELRTIDPWAAAQVECHPHRPTIMSKICHPTEVADRRFFDWLEMGGLRDTVAFELDRVPGHWTAMNLFLEHYDTDESAVLLRYCESHFELLSEAWRSSQHVVRCQQSGEAALNHLASHSRPACIVASTGEVFLANEAFHSLRERGIAKISTPSGRISISRNAQLEWVNESGELSLLRHDESVIDVVVQASSFKPDPMYARQKKNSYWLLRFDTLVEMSGGDVHYPVDRLTRQERQLFDAICNGASVQEAGQMIGLQRSRAFDVWSGVKQKLGIANSHALRGVLALP